MLAVSLSVLSLAALAAAHPRARTAGRALYLISNEATNQVVAIPIAADGTLSGGVAVGTGGSGANGLVGSAKQPAAPDALFSQSALTVVGQVSEPYESGSFLPLGSAKSAF